LKLKTHLLIRQLHLWIGAWGAIAAILFGISGFMQNHRGILKLPQGDTTEISSVELDVPESARQSREEMRAWLHDSQHVDVEIQRARGGGEGARAGGPGGRGSVPSGERGADGQGARVGERSGGAGPGGAGQGASKRWMFNGGNARILTQVEYVEGAPTVSIRKSENSPLAILSRLHKGVDGGIPWILLTDSFAVAMVLLGISGIILWARGRTAAQMAFSIVGVAVVVLLVIGGTAVI
jgi:uncharacterized protein